MIILHQYPGAFDLSSLSPFCIKVEFFLKMANLPYKIHVELNPKRGPKGKMPFIEDGQVIADSSFIIDQLIVKYKLGHLRIEDPFQEAQALAFKTMIEEGLYFALLYSRWFDPAGFKRVKSGFKDLFPPLMGGPFLELIRRSLIGQAKAQGIGRHRPDEVYAIGEKQIVALSVFLDKRGTFFEDKLTYFDATAYAFLSTILKQPIDSPLKKMIIERKNLCEYVERLDLKMRAP